jgi:hypothetical protein
MSPNTTVPPPKATALAAKILYHARRNDWDQVTTTANQLHTDYGDLGTQILIMGLADTLIARQGGPVRNGQPVQPGWLPPGAGAVTTNADDVPPRIRWAGRFIAARSAGDHDTCRALLGACATDEEFQDCVLGLIDATATTLNYLLGPP